MSGADGHLNVGLAGDHDDGQQDAEIVQVFEEGEAVLAGHDHVGEEHVEGLGLDEVEGARGVVADGGGVAGEAEGAGQGRESVGVIVDDQNVGQTRG